MNVSMSTDISKRRLRNKETSTQSDISSAHKHAESIRQDLQMKDEEMNALKRQHAVALRSQRGITLLFTILCMLINSYRAYYSARGRDK